MTARDKLRMLRRCAPDGRNGWKAEGSLSFYGTSKTDIVPVCRAERLATVYYGKANVDVTIKSLAEFSRGFRLEIRLCTHVCDDIPPDSTPCSRTVW
jgi:hypothetical protein